MAVLNTGFNRDGRLLTVDHFSYRYPEAENFTLRDISLVVRTGECHLLEGPTGAGKSTLLLAIRRLLPPGQSSGRILLHGAVEDGTVSHIALIQQNPVTQLLCSSLGAEVAFGLENRCEPPELMLARVEEVLRLTGLERPVDFPVDSLSMGQQYRACIAGQLVLEPRLVLMDEPVSQLDPRGREKMMQLIGQLKRAGVAVLVSEHRPDILAPLIDHRWQLTGDGRLVASGDSIPPLFTDQEGLLNSGQTPVAADSAGQAVIVVRDLRLQSQDRQIDFSHLALSVHKGECVVLHGPNGSGKTTLVRTMAGLIQPESGVMQVLDGQPSPGALRGRVSVLFQNPAQQLFETSVFAEVAFGARRSGMTEPEVAVWVELLLERLGIAELAMHSPHKLSYGQKHLVGFAAVLAARPEVVLLDDPFAGLDRDKVARVQGLLTWLARERGMTIVWTTHDREAVAGWPARLVEIVEIGAGQAAPGPEGRPILPRQIAVPGRSRQTKRERSGVFQMPTGPMLVLTILLSMLAFAAGSLEALVGLSMVNLLLLALFSPAPGRLLRKSGAIFCWQALLIVVLYSIRFGYLEGGLPGLQVAWQLFLAFWPGMIFMSANSQARIARTFSKILPQKTAFVASVCLRFLPALLEEMQQIREVQLLRGARLTLADLRNPVNWPDWLFCLTIPTLVATLTLATEIATAAAARDFGCHQRRTTWPGD